MSRKVGRITLAAVLMIAGAVVLIDNVLGTSIAWYVGRLWPALLIMLGLEWVAAATRAERDGSKAAADPGAIVGLIVVALIASSISEWRRAPINLQRRVVTYTQEAAPAPVPPALPFGNVSVEMVQSRDLVLSEVQELFVTSASEDVTIMDGPRAMVEMRVRAYGLSTADAENLARKVQMQFAPGRTTTVSAVRPPTTNRLEVSFVVTLPQDANTAVRVNVYSGSINASNRNGNVTLATNSGSVRAERIKGNVDLRTTSGSLVATDIQGDVAATSTSGSVQIEAVTGNAKVGATSGSLILRDVGGKVSAQSSSGSVAIDTGVVGGDWDVTAVSGGVKMTVPASAGITVTARASSGRVIGPSWLTIGEGRNSGTGTQGDGTYKLNLRSSSGDIRLDVR